MNQRKVAARIAFAAAAIHLVTAVVSLGLARGLPPGESSLARRIDYVGDHLLIWRAGWLLWTAAAVSLLALYVALYGLWKDNASTAARLAMLFAAAGFAPDLVAGAMFIGVMPGLGAADYSVVETIALSSTGYVANGLYTAAGILLTWAGRRVLPRSLLGLAALVWFAGVWLSAATITHSTSGQFASSAVLLAMFILWSGLLGMWLEKGRDRASS